MANEKTTTAKTTKVKAEKQTEKQAVEQTADDKYKDTVFVSTNAFICEDQTNKGFPKMQKFEENKAGEILEHPYLRVLVQTDDKNKDGKGVLLNLITFDENLIKAFEENKISIHSPLVIMNGMMKPGSSSIRVKSDNVFFRTFIETLEDKMKNKQFEYGNVALFGHPVDKGSSLEKGKINFLVMETDLNGKTATKFITLNLDDKSKSFFAKTLEKNGTFEKTYLNITGTIQKDDTVNLEKFSFNKSAYSLANLINRETTPNTKEAEKTTDINFEEEIPF